jgi:hypothetical protein
MPAYSQQQGESMILNWMKDSDHLFILLHKVINRLMVGRSVSFHLAFEHQKNEIFAREAGVHTKDKFVGF